jgi:MFS family permease
MPEPDQQQATVANVPADTSAVPRLVVSGSISWLRTFAAFRHRNYRLFFAGQLVSLVGTWMHMVAMGWLVYDITRSPLKLGFIGFIGALPMTLLTLPAGALADRVSKRTILLVTQIVSMLLAFTLAGIVWAGHVAVWQVATLAALLGTANAFDVPARQSFVIELVGKEDLMNAIALNSSMFNTARVVGPALAGLLIAYIGTAGCFLLNGISFLGVIVAYLLLRLPPNHQSSEGQSLWHATSEAVRFAAHERVIRAVITLVATMSLFGWWVSVLLPVFARDILHLEARGFGLLMAANGSGALLGALGLATLGNYPQRRRLFFGGLAGFCVMTALFAAARQPSLAGAALMGSGFCMIIFLATANTAVQLRTPDNLRGRVMGLYALSFLGLVPFGQILAGVVAESVGAPAAVWLGIAVCALVAITIFRLTSPVPATGA